MLRPKLCTLMSSHSVCVKGNNSMQQSLVLAAVSRPDVMAVLEVYCRLP